MSQATLIPSAPVSFPPLAYKGVPVVTTEMLATAYECEPKQIRQNFANNKERFIDGKHFFTLGNGELKAFRVCVENFDTDKIIPRHTRNLTLWIERGAARHAKMLNTDRAWDVFEMLEETFFRVARPDKEPTYLDAPITPDQQCTLQAMVKALVDKGGIYAAIWSRFNNHFRIAKYNQLPQSRMSEAVDYLMRFEVNPKALPKPEPLALPPAPDLDLTHYFDAMHTHSRRFMREYSDMILALKAAYPMNWNRQLDHGSADYAVLPMLDMVDNFAGILDGTLRAVENHARAFARVKRL